MTEQQQHTIFTNAPYTGVERTDNPVYPIFANIYKGMQGRFWIPENISMDDDKTKFKRLPKSAQDLFTMNLAWQIFADSDQGENLLYLADRTNNIEIKRCIIMQAMEESNHSGSYQYVISSMYDDPTKMLDRMEQDVAILTRRNASTHTGKLSNDIHPAIKMLAMEGISFTTSFITTLAVDRNFEGGLPGCKAQILKIAADESGHIVLWNQVLKILLNQKLVHEKDILEYFKRTVDNEMLWVHHLNKIHELPELEPKRIEKLLMLKTNQLARGLGISEVFPGIDRTSSLLNWYKRAININAQSVEPQASDGLAYVAGTIKDDWG